MLVNKYRPKKFKDFYGNTEEIKKIYNLLKKEKCPPCILISGPFGCGKTSLARLIAMALNCLSFGDGDVCCVCDGCLGILQNCSDFFEIDGATYRGIDAIRHLKILAQLRPMSLRNRVFLIDEAHQLTEEASSALLKILEEPPNGVFFILVTIEKMKIKDTVRSRAFHIDLKPPTPTVLRDFLRDICIKENLTMPDLDKINFTNFRDILMFLEGGRVEGTDLKVQVSGLWRTLIAGDWEGVKHYIQNALYQGIKARNIFLDFLDYIISLEAKGQLNIKKEIWHWFLLLYLNLDIILKETDREDRFLERLFGFIFILVRKDYDN